MHSQTGLEPRKLFNVVEFMMHDKDAVRSPGEHKADYSLPANLAPGGVQSGKIDMDECMEILFRRFGKDQLEQRTNGCRLKSRVLARGVALRE